jgi:hypothetical protein
MVDFEGKKLTPGEKVIVVSPPNGRRHLLWGLVVNTTPRGAVVEIQFEEKWDDKSYLIERHYLSEAIFRKTVML